MARPCATPAKRQAARQQTSSSSSLDLAMLVDVLVATKLLLLIRARSIALLHRICLLRRIHITTGCISVAVPVLHSRLIHRSHGGNYALFTSRFEVIDLQSPPSR